MINILGQNLTYIAYAFGIFVVCVTANIIIKTYFNTDKLNQNFDTKKLFRGIKKMLAIGITTALLAMVVTLIPYVPYLNVMFTDELSQMFCLGSVIALYGNAIIKYWKDAHTTTKDILENRNIIDDVDNESDGE